MMVRDFLVKAYSTVNQGRYLQTDWARRQFTRAYFRYKRHMDPLHANLVRRHPGLFRGGPVIDVGANIGYTSILFASAADPRFRVYAFEPEQRNFDMLRCTIRSSRYREQIVAVRAAVGQQDGVVELLPNNTSHAEHRVVTPAFKARGAFSDLTTVPSVSLDSFLAREQVRPLPCFVKVRVLGYELPVCLGLQRTLDAASQLVIALAYTPDVMKALGFDPSELIELFEQKGFAFYAISESGTLYPIPVPRRDLGRMMAHPSLSVKSQVPRPGPGLNLESVDRPGYLELLVSKKPLAI
jgi:FkbM family methyltransferase